MEETQLENGDYQWTFCSVEDKETYDALQRIADKYEVELNSPEFNDLFVTLLQQAVDRDLLKQPEQ